MSISVFLSGSADLSVHVHISGATCLYFTKFFVHFAYGHGSVLFLKCSFVPS